MQQTDQANSDPTFDELESLFVNNANLERIASYLNRFNPIRVMRMENMEIRHSAILAWLLDPNETHGFSDSFLRSFLAEALRGDDSKKTPTALDVSQADLRDAEIKREKENIDLFVTSPANGWAFIIENKFHSKQHSGQLERYIEQAKKDAKSANIEFSLIGIFLTLHDEDIADEAKEHYVPLRYADICKILETLLEDRRNTNTSSEPHQFIRYYLEIIRDATGENEELRKIESIAKQLYKNHRKALEFVIEHGKRTDFVIACDEIFGESISFPQKVNIGDETFVYSNRDSTAVSFLPDSWFNCLYSAITQWPGCERWWAGLPLISWIRLTPNPDGTGGKIRLYAEVGPLEPHSSRKKLIEAIAEKGKHENSPRIAFQRGAADEGRKYSRFLKPKVFAVNDIYDSEKIANAMREALKEYKKEFDAVAKALQSVVPELKEEQKQ